MKLILLLGLLSCASGNRYQGNKIEPGENTNLRVNTVSEVHEVLNKPLVQAEIKTLDNVNKISIEYISSKKCLPGIDKHVVEVEYLNVNNKGKLYNKTCEFTVEYGSCGGQAALDKVQISNKKNCRDF